MLQMVNTNSHMNRKVFVADEVYPEIEIDTLS